MKEIRFNLLVQETFGWFISQHSSTGPSHLVFQGWIGHPSRHHLGIEHPLSRMMDILNLVYTYYMCLPTISLGSHPMCAAHALYYLIAHEGLVVLIPSVRFYWVARSYIRWVGSSPISAVWLFALWLISFCCTYTAGRHHYERLCDLDARRWRGAERERASRFAETIINFD